MPVSTNPAIDAAARSLMLRHISAMIARVQAYFAQHQDAHLKLLRGHLFEQVDSRPHTTQAQNLRTAGMLLEQQAAAFNRAFQAALREAIEDEVESILPGALRVLRPAGDRDDSTGPASMALLDVDEIERHLLVDRVAQGFNNRYESGLKPLTQSLAALLREDDFALVDNPFRPASLVRAFLIAWHASAFDPLAAEDFVSALEPACSIDWAPLYADLAALLVRAGYSARSVHRIKRSAGGDSAHGAQHPASGASAGGGSGSAAASGAGGAGGGAVAPGGAGRPADRAAPAGPGEVAAGIGRSMAAHARQFLQKLGFGAAPADAAGSAAGSEFGASAGSGYGSSGMGGGPATRVPADPELMGYLGGLQAGAGISQFPPWAQGQDFSGQNLLRQMREREEVQRAPELDRGTVDALAEVFDYVFADKAIPLQLKYVIGRLQIPVLKAAIIDRDFFLSEAHPARQLVDALAAAAVAWTPEMGEADPLYARIDGTVKRVLAEFDHDLALFRELLAEFNQFQQDKEQQVQVQIAPAANQEQQHEARDAALAHADEVVHQCIHALPTDEPLAAFLLPFLAVRWREVLAHAWMAPDADRAQWDQALRVMDQIVWSTKPKNQADERARLMAMLPGLVRQIDASLDAIGWAGDERDHFTRRLIAAHMKAIRTPKPGPAPADSGPGELEVVAGREAVKALEQRVAAPTENGPDDPFDELARGFARGMWFDFEHQASQMRRYRLGWISPQRTRMLFTNRDGFEAFVRTEREVAAMLREGRLLVVDQQPIVARALDQIMADAQAPASDGVDLELS